LETFPVLNGYEIRASVDEQEQVILGVASGEPKRDGFKAWLEAHIVTRPSPASS
jgi:death-on-curing protein